jgi:tRNA threonylcarbamoyladenosine biosynthesis protein TsaB
VLTLAIDTSDRRGSVALLRDSAVLEQSTHTDASDYSEWLLPTVSALLRKASTKMEQVDLLAVSTGPGSFTGVRVGLTTAKAWAEVYKKPLVGISRLEAIARCSENASGLIAPSYDALRGQLFGALYTNTPNHCEQVIEEVVIAPEQFVELIDSKASDSEVTWVSLDPELLENLGSFKTRLSRGDQSIRCTVELAPAIALLAQERAAAGKFSDPRTLDANYVRRSDAEIFWKGLSAGGR